MSRAYLLLDRIQIANLADRLFELTGSAAVHSLYQHTAYSALDSVGPLLTGVTPDSPLEQVFWQAWSATAGIWLESEADEHQVLEHLRGLIHARAEGGATVFFRFYDPRITASWLADLPSLERDRLMGPVRLIRLPGLEFRQQTAQPAVPYAQRPWLVLAAEQLDHLNTARRESFTRQLIEHVQRHFPGSLNSLDACALRQWASDCQSSAARSGFSAVDEVLSWSRLPAVLGRDFPDGPEHGAYRRLLADPVLPRQRLDTLNNALTQQLLADKDLAL
ncbi:DUF4123 domain-containing protein [Pseudomonas sp. COR58]|uniref:DUF4123 domain-containing protein n=1 Tax=Pseudomonas ekonensis TaxID=2842353 RepID=A0ABS6PJK6_9PSED|nr:DUF4123 domain-containing protein [Pseudomonas ekonensis]MBV4460653.1 DUF4123 domain-containing protein [Pseudomonas ekonensis]